MSTHGVLLSSSTHAHTQTPTSVMEKSIFKSSVHKSLHSTIESNDFKLLIFQTILKSPTPGHEIKFVPSLKTVTADHENKTILTLGGAFMKGVGWENHDQTSIKCDLLYSLPPCPAPPPHQCKEG